LFSLSLSNGLTEAEFTDAERLGRTGTADKGLVAGIDEWGYSLSDF
jgi:hypothetical protein